MEKAFFLTERELASLLEIKGELVQAKELMYYGDQLSQYRGANYLLCSFLAKYNLLDKKSKDSLHIDVNNLERKAVEILVNQGHNKLVENELLKKYGYAISEKEK